MRKKMPKVLIIIPAYNEEESIIKVCEDVKNYTKELKYEIDYLVINDCSIDKTEDLLRQENIFHIRLIHNLGIGGAVQTGYKYAFSHDYDVAVQYDGDGQHDITYLEDLLTPICKENADMVIGSRFLSKEAKGFQSTFSRRIGIRLLSKLIYFVSEKKIKDTTSGFRAINKKLIKYFAENYPTEYPEPISSTQILREGYTILEVPVVMRERVGGVSSITSWKNVYYMLNVSLSLLVIKMRRKYHGN